MSAIATNGMKSGGAYTMLSRSLGPATGGSIGILFYFATALSGGMFIIGATEAISVSTGIHIGPQALSLRLMSVFLLIIILIISLLGPKLVAKTGFILLVITILSILAMIIGIFFAHF